jgi:hypothetical protein
MSSETWDVYFKNISAAITGTVIRHHNITVMSLDIMQSELC